MPTKFQAGSVPISPKPMGGRPHSGPFRVMCSCHAIVPWAILLCKLENYNSALRELSLRPLTKVSPPLSLSLIRLNFAFAFTGIRETRRNVDRHSAAGRRGDGEEAAFSLPSSRMGFRFVKSPNLGFTRSLHYLLSLQVPHPNFGRGR